MGNARIGNKLAILAEYVDFLKYAKHVCNVVFRNFQNATRQKCRISFVVTNSSNNVPTTNIRDIAKGFSSWLITIYSGVAAQKRMGCYVTLKILSDLTRAVQGHSALENFEDLRP